MEINYIDREQFIDKLIFEANLMERESGMIRSLNMPQRTYGFVTTGIKEYFFHWTDYDLKSDKPFHHLKIGDTITFEPSMNGEKSVAKNLHFKFLVDTRKKRPPLLNNGKRLERREA